MREIYRERERNEGDREGKGDGEGRERERGDGVQESFQPIRFRSALVFSLRPNPDLFQSESVELVTVRVGSSQIVGHFH